MSQILNALQAMPDNNLGGTDKTFIDADTLVDHSGERYRIQGVNANEVSKVVGGKLKQGTAGGQASTDITSKLATDQGFTNVVPVLDHNGEPQRDQFGRTLVDLKDKAGNSFNQSLLNAGAFDINKYTTDQQIAGREIAEAQRARSKLEGNYSENAFDVAANMINEAERQEGEKQLGFKIDAVNEAQRQQFVQAGLGHMVSDSVQVDHFDRNLNNESTNPMSDAWDIGWAGAKEGMYGMMELLGEELGNEALADMGTDGIERMKYKQQEYGSILTDYKDVDSFGSAMQFLGNNMAMSLPYMVITAGGAAAGAAATAATGGGALAVAGGVALGTAPSAAVYAGQTWNEMEGEKNAGVAIGAGLVQASLDRLGLGGVAGKLVPDRAFQQGVQHIMKKQGLSKEAAEQLLSNATKQEARGLMQEGLKIATKQQNAKRIGKDLLKRAGVSSGTEAITEMGQEATAYLGATIGSDKQFDWEELNQRMVAAAIAGGALGGALSAPGSLRQGIQEADLAFGAEAATDATASVSQQYADAERAEKGYVPSIDENIMEINQKEAGFASQQDRAARYKERQGKKSTTDRFLEAVQNPGALFKGATANIFTPELQQRSRAARVMADMFGGNLQRIYSGANYENFKFHQVATYKNMVSRPEMIFSAMGKGDRITRKKKEQISSKLYDSFQKGLDKEGNFNPDAIPDTDPDKQTVLKVQQELQVMSDRMYEDQKKYNPELGYQKNYLLKYKSLSKEAVNQNKKKFEDLLVSDYNYSPSDAKALTEEITTNTEANDIDEAFSVIKGGPAPNSHKKRSLGMSENKNFAEFMEQDMFANLSTAAKSAARYTAHQKFIGKNASVISKLLDQMESEGVSEAETDKVAAMMQDYLDAESGNYKRPQTTQGKKLQKIQKSAMMFMTMSGLPLATVSSFVELMLTNRGLTSDQVWGKDGSIKAMTQEAGKGIIRGMGEVASFASRKEVDIPAGKSEAQAKLGELGFYDWDVGAATVTGVTEVNAFQRRMYETFFKAIGLQQWTDYTRAVRASVGADYLVDNAEIIWQHKMGKSPYTRDVQQAEEKLRNLGIDTDRFAEVQTKVTAGLDLTPEEQSFFQDSIREGTFNFVNEAIALPQAANRPLIYQDPRFALFTQFQGFIATFTANHIPKLWGEYVKRGTPAMKYNAFATMATMIAMGFLSQHMKDWIKYQGDEEEYDFKTGKNPYLDTAEYLQRGVYASGLLGVAERPLQWLNPIYEQRHDGVADWAFNSIVGESPALGWGERVARGAGHVASGDLSRGVEQLGKAAPLIGPFSRLNRGLGAAVEDWNFNGE